MLVVHLESSFPLLEPVLKSTATPARDHQAQPFIKITHIGRVSYAVWLLTFTPYYNYLSAFRASDCSHNYSFTSFLFTLSYRLLPYSAISY